MQHRREADLAAETLRVGGDCQQRLGTRLEQQVVDDGLVVECDRRDARRQREHDMEVGHLQQLGLARLQPFPRLRSLALRTMPITTGVVRDHGMSARGVLTTRNMATEGRRAATLDRVHHLHLRMTEMAPVGETPSRTVVAEDIRNLQG